MGKDDWPSQANLGGVRAGPMRCARACVQMDDHPFVRDFIFRELAPSELSLALDVRRAVYVDELRYEAARVLEDPFDQRARHFVGTTRAGEPVAAMRTIEAHARPFELESFVSIAPFLPEAGHPAEMSRMCIIPRFRRIARTQFVHAGMSKLAYAAATAAGITELWCWATLPIVGVYGSIGFHQVPGLSFVHPLFGNNEYHVMRVDLRKLEAEYRRRKHPLADFLFGPSPGASAGPFSSGDEGRGQR